MKRLLLLATTLIACRVEFDRDRLAPTPPTIVEQAPPEKCPAAPKPRCSRTPFESPLLLVKNVTGGGYNIGGPALRTFDGNNELWLHVEASGSVHRLDAIPVNTAFVPAKTNWAFFEDTVPVLQSAGAFNDDPAFGGDGAWIVWASRRLKLEPQHLRFAAFDREANDWMRPVALAGFDSLKEEQWGPAPSYNGCRLFFAAGKRDVSGDIYLATGERGAWSSAVPIETATEPAAQYDDTEPTVSADGRTVIFASNRATKGGSNYDLWIAEEEASTADGGPTTFSPPRLLPSDSVNTDATEKGPHLSADGCTLVFSRPPAEIWISRRQPDQ